MTLGVFSMTNQAREGGASRLLRPPSPLSAHRACLACLLPFGLLAELPLVV